MSEIQPFIKGIHEQLKRVQSKKIVINSKSSMIDKLSQNQHDQSLWITLLHRHNPPLLSGIIGEREDGVGPMGLPFYKDEQSAYLQTPMGLSVVPASTFMPSLPANDASLEAYFKLIAVLEEEILFFNIDGDTTLSFTLTPDHLIKYHDVLATYQEAGLGLYVNNCTSMSFLTVFKDGYVVSHRSTVTVEQEDIFLTHDTVATYSEYDEHQNIEISEDVLAAMQSEQEH